MKLSALNLAAGLHFGARKTADWSPNESAAISGGEFSLKDSPHLTWLVSVFGRQMENAAHAGDRDCTVGLRAFRLCMMDNLRDPEQGVFAAWLLTHLNAWRVIGADEVDILGAESGLWTSRPTLSDDYLKLSTSTGGNLAAVCTTPPQLPHDRLSFKDMDGPTSPGYWIGADSGSMSMFHVAAWESNPDHLRVYLPKCGGWTPITRVLRMFPRWSGPHNPPAR